MTRQVADPQDPDSADRTAAVQRPLHLENPRRQPGFRAPAAPPAARAFHERLPLYQRTRLARLDDLAGELGVGRLWVKDESSRLGLPAFKVLGVSWAMYRALSERLGTEPGEWRTLDELRAAFAPLQPLTVTAATDGNHGRALARVARWLGVPAVIHVPRQVPPERAAAIRSEGATVVVVDGTYDDAVDAAFAAAAADDRTLLVSDTAATEDEVVPRWIVEGYSTLFAEADEQLAELGEPGPELVLVQIGVGALAGAAAIHYRRAGLAVAPRLVGVEPLSAACLLESARDGARHVVPGPHTSAMDCLNAGAPSMATLADLLAGFDAFVAVGDALVPGAIQALARAGVVSGATGVAGLVALRELRDELGLTERTSVLIVNSEGVADPSGYAAALLAAG
ncbi:MAG TPA: diaminopropionate ammonia-lyase [Baekduia sp.]|uniref:diaminopropionate ammonia-lyase n=1 Tax=Baekduia sp. TaxID=2600305 RepID=UPI002D787F40|nr:diaminopropionate ammonia-lyase [Baekduia sp.]HET6509906.1 diaminopropionate ammonia-lyase [Baekduia sp.]